MKKTLLPLLLLPTIWLASCDSNDMAQVDISLGLDGITLSDSQAYSVVGDTISIQDLTVKSLNGKESALGNMSYYWDGFYIGGFPGYPFDGKINTEGLKAGTHYLSFAGTVLEVDKSPTYISTDIPINLVDTVTDLPANAPEIGLYTISFRLNASEKE